jgi:hypothetical protein
MNKLLSDIIDVSLGFIRAGALDKKVVIGATVPTVLLSRTEQLRL